MFVASKKYVVVLLAIGVCLAYTSEAVAGDEWDVIDGSGDWNDGANWSHGAVPLATGNVTIAANGAVNVTSVAATKQLALGNDWSGDDAAIGGDHAGPGTLNVLPGGDLSIKGFIMGAIDDLVGLEPSGTVNQTGGLVTVSNWMEVGSGQSGNAFGGDGFYNISGGTLDVNTFLRLGTPNKMSFGTLSVAGSSGTIDILDEFRVSENGTVKFVFNDASGVSTIAVGGNARIDNAAKLEVVLDAGATFNVNDVFTLIDSATGITGNNNLGAGPHIFSGLEDNAIIQIGNIDTFRINYDPITNFTVTLTSLRNIGISGPGDFNFDGNVNGTDFLLWQRGGSPAPLSASDLSDWETNFGAASPPLSSALSVVPEPSSLLISLVGMMITTPSFSRRRFNRR